MVVLLFGVSEGWIYKECGCGSKAKVHFWDEQTTLLLSILKAFWVLTAMCSRMISGCFSCGVGFFEGCFCLLLVCSLMGTFS